MKYSIHGFSQPRAVELGLSNDDLLVLRWFVDFCGTGKMQSIKEPEGIYYWVNYQSVLDDLPVLRISKDWLARKCFKALCDAQVLCHKHIKKGGSFSYYGFGINYESLVYIRDNHSTEKNTEGAENTTQGYGGNSGGSTENTTQGYGGNSGAKINLLNQSIINNSTKKQEKGSSDIGGEIRCV